VNKNNEMVIAYLRAGLELDNPLAACVRYNVFYHNETEMRESAPLKDGENLIPGTQVDIPDIDLPGIALDPSDNRTIWFASTYGDSGAAAADGKFHSNLHPVIGAVRP